MNSYKIYWITCLLFFCNSGLYSQSTCPPEANYCFNGDALDESGNGYDGSVSMASLTSGRYGVENTAYKFNSSNAEITINADSLISSTYTYVAWVMPSQIPASDLVSGAHAILSIGNAGGDQFLHLANRGSNGIGFCLVSWSSGPVRETACSGTLPSINKWYHVAAIRTSDSIKLFVDGQLMESKALQVSTPAYTNSPIGVIGARHQNLTPWKGKIDDVTIFTCELSNSEIADLYSSSQFCQLPDECESDALFCLDGDAQDQSGNGFHGTLSNVTETKGRNGLTKSAYEFSGNMSLITFPGDSLSSSTFSYAAWVNPSQNPTYDPLWGTHGILNIGNTGGDHYLHLANKGQNGEGFCLISWSKGPVKETVCSGALPTLNQWYHVTGVRTADSMKLYVNGLLKGSAVLNVREPSFTMPVKGIIGARLDTATFWKGKIDEVAVYNCAISASKVSELYNASPYCSESTSMAGKVADERENFRLYPNPSNGKLTLTLGLLSDVHDVSYKLVDTRGRVLNKSIVHVGASKAVLEVDYSHVSKGTYFLQISAGQERTVKRVVIQ